jgi:hypothetical protein
MELGLLFYSHCRVICQFIPILHNSIDNTRNLVERRSPRMDGRTNPKFLKQYWPTQHLYNECNASHSIHALISISITLFHTRDSCREIQTVYGGACVLYPGWIIVPYAKIDGAEESPALGRDGERGVHDVHMGHRTTSDQQLESGSFLKYGVHCARR